MYARFSEPFFFERSLKLMGRIGSVKRIPVSPEGVAGNYKQLKLFSVSTTMTGVANSLQDDSGGPSAVFRDRNLGEASLYGK
jgi:hypothetical protein